MTMTLSGALAAIATIQSGLSVDFVHTQPDGSTLHVQESIQRVYGLPPDESTNLTNVPCWVNLWSFKQDERGLGMSQRSYDVHMRLYLARSSETNLLADVATHFHDAFLTALWANLRLVDGQGAVNANLAHHIRGGEPTLAKLLWNGLDYIGLDYHLDFDQVDGVTFG